MRSVAILMAVAVSSATVATAQVDTSIVPLEGRTTWAPGVQHDIPARLSVCATVQAADFGNGTVEASAAIQAAIASCPPGRTVRLSSGTFLTNKHILLNKGITLRGAGTGLTKLLKTDGAKVNDYRPLDGQPIIIVGPTRWPKSDATGSVDLAADAVKGENVVTVTSTAGFEPGQFVLLDEDEFNTASWIPVPPRLNTTTKSLIWATDRVVFQRHNPGEPNVDDGFPESLSWFSRTGRPLSEIKEITAVTGTRITFSTPLHAAYTTSRRAQLTRYSGENAHLRDAGVEDMTVSGGGGGNIKFEAAAYSWMKNVENTMWLGEAVGVYNSFRIELRDSFIHDAAWPYPGGGGYAISLSWGASEVLIENNIITKANKVLAVRSAGAGSVVGYNYVDNGYIGNMPDWVEVGLNGSHQAGSHHMLFEGNHAWNYDSDNTHGNAFAMTIFRNHLTGRRSEFTGMSNARTAGLMFGSWWHSFIGNVLGEPGRMGGWVYEDPGDGTSSTTTATSVWGPTPAIWRLGYDPTHWGQHFDPKVRSTTLRDGNFDFLTNQVRWDRAPRMMPDSLYLSAKPAFFGDNPWPWVDPTGATKVGVLPARQRFEARAATVGAPGPPRWEPWSQP